MTVERSNATRFAFVTLTWHTSKDFGMMLHMNKPPPNLHLHSMGWARCCTNFSIHSKNAVQEKRLAKRRLEGFGRRTIVDRIAVVGRGQLQRLSKKMTATTTPSFSSLFMTTTTRARNRTQSTLNLMPPTLAEPRTSVITGGRKRITSKYTDGSEVLEEYDVIKDDLLLRKRRTRNALGGFSDWVVEVGAETRSRNLDKELIMEANGSPEVILQDTAECHVVRIRNLPYTRDVYDVGIVRKDDKDVGEIVVRTTNKKYFKRLTIPEMCLAQIPLDPTHLGYEVKHNTLIIHYKKHLAILEAESRAKKERSSLPSKRVDEKNQDCPVQ